MIEAGRASSKAIVVLFVLLIEVLTSSKVCPLPLHMSNVLLQMSEPLGTPMERQRHKSRSNSPYPYSIEHRIYLKDPKYDRYQKALVLDLYYGSEVLPRETQ